MSFLATMLIYIHNAVEFFKDFEKLEHINKDIIDATQTFILFTSILKSVNSAC